jgi:hypothetical protein
MNCNLVSIAAMSILLASCGGEDSGSPTLVTISTNQPSVPAPTSSTVDKRYKFEPFSYTYMLPTGDTTVRYRVGEFKSSDQFLKTANFKIEDYSFFEATVTGLNNGCPRSECGEEYAPPGPWNHRPYQIIESDINRDGYKDFYLFEWIHNSREEAPDDLIHAFINDGQGHFMLSNDSVFDSGKACTSSGAEFPAQFGRPPKDRNSKCGYQLGVVRHVLVADFNKDGVEDIFGGMVLQLSNGSKLYNKTLTNLPEYFRKDHMDPLFTHDQYAADATGDSNLDVFMPAKLTAAKGYWGDGTRIAGCTECVATVPWSLLVNDGTGKFTLNQNFPIMGVGKDHPLVKQYMPHNEPNKGILWGGNIEELWATTAAVADFDRDGRADVVVGWSNPRATQTWGMGTNSTGAVYYNDGNNDWRNRPIVTLPTSFYNNNGNANDMEVMDFDEDGWVDIIVASTKQNPYYEGRVIQFFKNNRNGTFSDVTSSVYSDYTRYANGTGTPLWNGEGQLRLIDFNNDGRLDIVDSTTYTYVLLNAGNGRFTLYDSTNFPRNSGSDGTYFPVKLDGKYGFIGYSTSCLSNSCTTAYFQVKPN